MNGCTAQYMNKKAHDKEIVCGYEWMLWMCWCGFYVGGERPLPVAYGKVLKIKLSRIEIILTLCCTLDDSMVQMIWNTQHASINIIITMNEEGWIEADRKLYMWYELCSFSCWCIDVEITGCYTGIFLTRISIRISVTQVMPSFTWMIFMFETFFLSVVLMV